MISNHSTMNSQQGATLVVALTVVMVVGLLATSVSYEFLNMTRRVENQTEARQVKSYLVAAESVARQVLLEDIRLSPELDYGLEPWARPLNLELPIGIINACMVDLQGKLNLNDMASPADDGYSPEQRRFIRLLQVLDLDNPLTQSEAIALANAVFDWVDPDSSQRFPGGAEDLYYYQQETAGKAANQRFASVSELRLVRGMTGEIYSALTPHVTLWGNGELNLNSADAALNKERLEGNFVLNDLPPPVILRTLNAESQLQPQTEDLAMQMINNRINSGGFRSLDFLDQGKSGVLQIAKEGLGLTSGYFNLVSELEVGNRRYQMQAVLYRYVDDLGIPGVRTVERKILDQRIEMDDFCVN